MRKIFDTASFLLAILFLYLTYLVAKPFFDGRNLLLIILAEILMLGYPYMAISSYFSKRIFRE